MFVYPSTVPGVVNGSAVEASNTNQAAVALTQRTDWLRAQILALTAGTGLRLQAQTIEAGLPPGTPVYYDTTTLSYKAALAALDSSDFVTAAPSAVVEGIVLSLTGTVGTVLVNGLMQLTTVQWASVFDTGVFGAGEVFLSTTTGKISLLPGVLGLSLGTMRPDGSFVFRPANPGAFLQHVHLQRFLTGEPAGTVVDPVFPNPQVVTTPNPAVQGWLPATPTYFPGFVVGVQIPTGAKFGYNIQHPSETALREIFPMLPPENAQFSQSGLVLSADKVVTNSYGIWWMDDAYGEAPWPVPYLGTAPEITLWTSRLIADVSLSATITQSVLAALANGELANLGVTRAIPGDNSITITGPNGDIAGGFYGPVTFNNTGAKSVTPSAGIAAAGTLGTPTQRRGAVTLRSIASRPAQFLHNKFTAPQTEALLPVTTNGVPVGVDIGLYGQALGPDTTDFIDYVLMAGQEFAGAESISFTLDLALFVDDPAGVPTNKEINLLFYEFNDASPSSSASLIRTHAVTVQTGLPGQQQRITVPAFVDVQLSNTSRGWLLRFENGTGPSALAAGKLRIAGVVANLEAP